MHTQTFSTTEPTRRAFGDACAVGSVVVFSYSMFGDEPIDLAPDVRQALDQLDRQMVRDHVRARMYASRVRRCTMIRQRGRARTAHRAVARSAAKPSSSSDGDPEPPGDIAARAERAS